MNELVRLDIDARGRLGVPKNVVSTLPLESLRRLASDKLKWKALCKEVAVRARFEWLVNYRKTHKLAEPEDNDDRETIETPRLHRNKRY